MWRNAKGALLVLGLVSTSVATVRADETSIVLKGGAGLENVKAACSMCHSLDYIQMNSVFLDQAGWEKTVNKMIKVMGAPISPEDASTIVVYLATNYGKMPAP
jgi:cytochrome c5